MSISYRIFVLHAMKRLVVDSIHFEGNLALILLSLGPFYVEFSGN